MGFLGVSLSIWTTLFSFNLFVLLGGITPPFLLWCILTSISFCLQLSFFFSMCVSWVGIGLVSLKVCSLGFKNLHLQFSLLNCSLPGFTLPLCCTSVPALSKRQVTHYLPTFILWCLLAESEEFFWINWCDSSSHCSQHSTDPLQQALFENRVPPLHFALQYRKYINRDLMHDRESKKCLKHKLKKQQSSETTML